MRLNQTIAVYDQIATEYMVRWQDRRMMEGAMAHFRHHIPARGRILDVGCGPGFDAALFRQHGFAVIGLDYSWGMLQTAQTHFPGSFLQGDMRALPFGSDFDGLWVNASLLHLPRQDVPVALHSFCRVLKSGGILYLSLKEGVGEEWHHAGYYDSPPRFFTYWQAYEMDGALAAAGFEVVDRWRTDTGQHKPWLSRLARKRS